MALTDAMAAVARVGGTHPAIKRAYAEIPATVNEWPSLLVLPGTTQQLEESLDGADWLYVHRVRVWLMVAPMDRAPISRLQDAASWAPEIMRLINRAFVDQDPEFDPYQAVSAIAYDAQLVPTVAEVAFWGGQITVEVKEHTLYGSDT